MGSSGKATTEWHTFDSEVKGSHNYVPDGGATDRWFMEHTNASEIYDELESHEDYDEFNKFDYEYFDLWTEGHFMYGQQYDGFSKMSRVDQRMTRILDHYIDKSVLNEPIVVHRRATAEMLFGKGHTFASEDEIKSMNGQEFVVKGNMSTGAGKEGLTIGSRKQIDYEIRIPKGKGWGLWLGNARVNDYWRDAQREFITNRDLVFRQIGYKKVLGGTGGSKPMYTVIVEVVGRMKHDYS